jgi:hypothetical protein
MYPIACSKNSRIEADFRLMMENRKHLSVYEIMYSDQRKKQKIFSKGYSIEGEKVIDIKTIQELAGLIKDSTNYLTDRSKNCVMVANYGIKLSGDSLSYLLFIGKDPCLKILVLNERMNTERVYDLTDNNNIVPFFDSLFLSKSKTPTSR